MTALGVLYNPLLPQGSLLDAIKFSETGHLSADKARTAVSRAGAVGPYQFMQKFLPDFGYGMPKNIPLSDVQDTTKSRQLADQFVTGYSNYHNFETPIEKLVAYNAGPSFAAQWKAAGANIADLPAETQKYIQKAAAFLTRKGNDDMAYLGMPSETDPNLTIDGQVISPKEAARRRIDEAIRMSRTPPSSYMAPFYNPAPPPPPQAMAMPSETNPNVNIDGTLVGDDSLLYMVGQGIGNALETGQNARPQNPPPPALAPSDDVVQSNAALMQAMGINPAAASSSGPALTYSQTPTRPRGVGQVSQNRRDMSAMSMVPSPQQIGLNEMLIRMGSAGLRGAQTSGLESLAAMGDAYAGVQDANRATGLAAYQAQMEALADGTTAKQKAENMERVGQIDQTLFDMDRALGYLEEDGMSLTGFFDSTFGAAWDNIVGNPEASARLLLKKLRVDDTLLRVAQTKGAISNKEMDLFMSPAPQDTQDEQVWIDWIKDRQIALRDVRRRLATGEQASNPASSSQVDQFSQQGQGDFSLSGDDQALVNKYL